MNHMTHVTPNSENWIKQNENAEYVPLSNLRWIVDVRSENRINSRSSIDVMKRRSETKYPN